MIQARPSRDGTVKGPTGMCADAERMGCCLALGFRVETLTGWSRTLADASSGLYGRPFQEAAGGTVYHAGRAHSRGVGRRWGEPEGGRRPSLQLKTMVYGGELWRGSREPNLKRDVAAGWGELHRWTLRGTAGDYGDWSGRSVVGRLRLDGVLCWRMEMGFSWEGRLPPFLPGHTVRMVM